MTKAPFTLADSKVSATLESDFDTILIRLLHSLALKPCQSQIKVVQEPFLKSQ